MQKLRWWLIRFLAGKDLIVLNAKFPDDCRLSNKFSGQRMLVCDSEFLAYAKFETV